MTVLLTTPNSPVSTELAKLTDIAWAAGLIEGEGCFTLHSDMKRPYFLLDMTDKDVLERFQEVFPNTNLRGPYKHKNKEHHKPRWRVDAYGDACVYIMQSVYPYMFTRRKEKIDELISKDQGRAIDNNRCK